MATVLSPPDQRIILRNVSWDTYERLLEERGDGSVPRFSYDQGVLEIMSPSLKHEELKCLLAQIVEVVAEELEIDLMMAGSTTFKRQDLTRGFEPDACFYIESLDLVWGKSEIDLLVDPAPDLLIEIDISTDSLKKSAIYAVLGVPEVWRYDGSELTVLQLEDTGYIARERSVALPILTTAGLAALIEEGRSMRSTARLRKLRSWIRGHAGK